MGAFCILHTMKTRFTLDLSVFYLMLKELRLIRKELQIMNGSKKAPAKPLPAREISDKIFSEDVLKLLRITSATLNNYEKKGFIPFHQEGRKKVYSQAEIQAFKKLKRGRKRLGKNFSAVKDNAG